MININDIQNIYFIGIGGIGMSALARYFQSKGAIVSGYDKTPTPLTKELEQSGMKIHYEENIELVPKDTELVIYTPAMSASHTELAYYKEHNYKVVKRSDVLGWITESSYNICIGGTHGKTTVSAITAHILRHSGYGCNAFLGGISSNYKTNFWSSNNNVSVIEADEYDRSFLKLKPDVAIITSMDADHLDIYGTAEEMENAFIEFSQNIKQNGCLISKYELKRSNELKAKNYFTYSFNNSNADVYVQDLKIENGSYRYNVVHKNWKINDVSLHMGGLHNVENSVASITTAKYLDVQDEKIKNAIANFKGVKRRFEYVLKDEKHVLIDDYAHHPQELKALLTGVQSLYPNKKCTVMFQPHLYTRTKDFAKEFAQSLDLADEVILLPIYPARELPIEGVTSEMILNFMHLPKKEVLSKEEVLHKIKKTKPDLLVMCGAGDIDALVELVKNILLN